MVFAVRIRPKPVPTDDFFGDLFFHILGHLESFWLQIFPEKKICKTTSNGPKREKKGCRKIAGFGRSCPSKTCLTIFSPRECQTKLTCRLLKFKNVAWVHKGEFSAVRCQIRPPFFINTSPNPTLKGEVVDFEVEILS